MNRRSAPAYAANVVLVLLIAGCSGRTGRADLNLAWRPVPGLAADLPAGLRVYEGEDRRAPIRAWYVRVDAADTTMTARVVISEDVDRRETVTQFAERLEALVVVNGGYFVMESLPARHAGLLHIEGRSLESATVSVMRDSLRYPVLRGTLGLGGTRRVDVAWASSHGDTLFEWDAPLPNRPGTPADSPLPVRARLWPVRDAVAAGPVLIRDGRIEVAVDEEVFFGSSIPDVHPRTAAGHTRRGDLILLVVDGRQSVSRGVSLQELAAIMKSLDCVEAVNLDGGGSSSVVVNGRLLNRPAGGSAEREVMSAIAVLRDPRPGGP